MDINIESRSTQMVRVRIIKTTKYAHVKDGEVADSIAVEHNVLATFFPTLFHRRRTESNRTADGNRLDSERNPIGRRTESDRTADANGGTLRGCTCLRSALPLARARSAPTEQERTNRARTAPSASPISSNILPQNTQNSQNLLLRILPQISRKYTDC